MKPVTASMLLDAVVDASASGAGVRRRPRTGAGAGSRRLSGMRILVVEDNLINQQVAEELLMSEGALVALAANGQQGVEAIVAAAASKQFDAVLMDMQMPVLDGFGATRVIRKQLQLVRLPIIAMTANAMASDRAECLAAGMNEHVGKPFDLDHLVHTLLRVTDFQATEPVVVAVQESALAPANVAVPSAVEVPKLDVSDALARMDGMTALYVRLARQFLDALPGQLAELHAALTDARGQATLLAHTLKGTAALLGVTPLSQAAAALEKLCKAGASDVELQSTWLRVESVAKADAASLQAALLTLAPDPAERSQAAQSPVHSKALTQAMAELKPLLDAEDFSVLEKFAQVRGLLAELPDALLSPLEEALQDLDMEAALQACSSIEDWASCQPVT
jgi:CheY-like chemotaxis protein